VAASVAGFVGRERELSSLQGALGGDARLLLVVGDAGVGKTRLVREGMQRAVAGGQVSGNGSSGLGHQMGLRAFLTNRRWLILLAGTAGTWFLLDYAYYGNTISTPQILSLISPTASTMTKIALQLPSSCPPPSPATCSQSPGWTRSGTGGCSCSGSR
jgi:DNA replicative helicase MCM subunit Mcm2 (Cdc46/Mcm family)